MHRCPEAHPFRRPGAHAVAVIPANAGIHLLFPKSNQNGFRLSPE
jgi:hypothetical protein